MKTVTIRDLRTRPRQVREALGGETEAILTANGRPVAILVPTDASTIDQTLDLLRRARGLEALRALRQGSRRGGTSRMSSGEVDQVIARVRRARRSRRS
jgi:antitoxin (DNA-binding transcriptional repressor) of toxin-antitoxin stability system